jgi:dTDP-4-dehydrorhamnose reductase
VRLLVTGGRHGYLGTHVVDAARAAGHDVVPVGSADADLRDAVAIEALVDEVRPDAVVHTAYVQSDWHVTATGSAHLALAAARHGTRTVLVSSDVVFSGADRVYAESAPPDPITAYGAAKAAAETTVLAACPDAVVARTSLILGDGRSQHERLVHALLDGTDGALFEDERRCPVHVADLAAALVELAGADRTGVLHVAGADPMSRLELGRLVAARDGLDATALRGTTRAAARVAGPVDVRLDSSLAAEVLRTRLRGAREFLS